MKPWPMFVALLIALSALLLMEPVQPWLLDPHGTPLENEWFTVLHALTNQVHLWRLDALPTALGLGAFSPQWWWWYYLAVCAGGITAALRQLVPWPAALCGALLSTTAVAMVFGNDLVTLGSIAWLPALGAVVLLSANSQRLIPPLILALFVALRLTQSANQLGPLMVVACVTLAWLLLRSHLPRTTRICLALVAAVTLISYARIPTNPLPHYPQGTHVVPDEGVPGFTRPILGQAPSIPLIDREVVRQTLRPLSWTLLASGLLLLLTLRQRAARILVTSALVLAAAAVIDTVPPETISEIGPIQTVQRLLPGLFFFTLTFPALAVALLLLIGSPLLEGRVLLAVLVVLMSVVGSAPSESVSRLMQRDGGVIWRSTEIEARREFVAAHPDVPQLFSPSLPVFWRHPHFVRERGTLSTRGTYRTPTRLGGTIVASHRFTPDELAPLLSHRSGRWSAQRGRQEGDEWLYVVLQHPETVIGVRLATGQFTSDFPRGLRVSVPEGCPADPKSASRSKEVFAAAQWLGQIHFTEAGYPFFGDQRLVAPRFYQPVTTRCLLIEQTGRSRSFDWSVTHLDLILPRE